MAKKKIQLQDANGNVLHPLTLGECVTMDNGENLDALMSKSQMFTPTITQDKSMFKVGTGVDVDYSANVKDGAYESLVFKGKSLVNLSNLHKSFDNTNLSGYYCDTSLCETSKLKLGTPYTLVFYTTVHDGDHSIYKTIELGVADSLHSTQAHPRTTNGHRGVLVKNGWSRVCVSFTDLLGYKYLSLRPIRCDAPESGKSIRFSIKGFILLEGDWSNKDLPFNDYFDGIGCSKMPILRNIGKNLFNINQPYDHAFTPPQKYFIENNKLHFIEAKNHENLCWLIKVSKGERIYCSCLEENNKGKIDVRFFSEKRVSSNFTNRNSWDCDGTIKSTICSDEWMLLMLNTGSDSAGDFVFTNIIVSYYDTTYEDHKTNILRTSEEVVLREVDGVQDTYNPLTGEYTKRIGEFILNGSDNETWGNHEVKGDNAKFGYFPTLVAQGTHQSVECLCDKWKADSQANETIQEQISLYNHMPNGTPRTEVRITVSPTRLQSADVTGFRTWLSQNPLTVQYILAQPVTTIVKPSTMTPFAYQNGHVILESGFEGQSLLPEIEYSVVTGRTGQVTQNTKVLRKQEQQITSLEELLLTQVVQMEYERTLLQFDYELQMMMLG